MKIDLILLIILGIIVSYVFIIYKVDKINKIDKIEFMTDVNDQIAVAVKNYYLSDEFIKNISLVSVQLQKDGLIIPGNLTIKGDFNYLPKGTIVAFNSDKAPEGWALCDGQNGTPDLRGRFIRMQSDSLGDFNEWGGKIVDSIITSYDKTIGGISRSDQKSYILNHKFGDRAGTDHQILDISEIPAHTHGMDNAGEHRHRYIDRGNTSGAVEGSKRDRANNTSGVYDTEPAGNHTHKIHNAGNGWGHNNQPPYVVLSYIMKL